MTQPVTVNDQIVDSVTATSVKVLAESPSMAMGSIFQSQAHSLGIVYANAAAVQQQQNTVALAVVQRCVSQLTDIGRPSAASVAVPVEAAMAPVDLTTALSRLADAMGEARERSGDADHDKRVQTLRQAAVAGCLAAMASWPEHAQAYAQLLAQIQAAA